MTPTQRKAMEQALEFMEYHSKYWNGTGEHPTAVVTALRAALKEDAESSFAKAEQTAEQEPVAQRWQPIETAPKGRIVLVHYKNSLGNGRTMRARYYLPETLDSDTTESGWADEGWYEESEAYEYLMPLDHDPTHWMPLPAAPDTSPQPAKPAEQDDYKAWYEEAMCASNEAGFVGLDAAQTIRELARQIAEAPQPAKRVPLTDDEITAIAFTQHNYPQGTVGSAMFRKGVRYAEAAHDITGETK